FAVFLMMSAPGLSAASQEESPVGRSLEEREAEVYARFRDIETNRVRLGFETVFPDLLALAQEGSALAQETVGRMYSVGMGVKLDRCEGTYWMDKAARAGRPWAQHLLGWSYWNGDGVLGDHELAYLWFQTAVRNGRKEAVNPAQILANTDLFISQVRDLDEKLQLRIWRPENQPPAHIIRVPNIWGLNWVMVIFGLRPCHFPR
ncbi:MAG: tetratricopeptide repeat protein, partial [Saprospiraceae bacterium]